MDELFDIAHARAMEDISIEEDRAFLLAQREKGRRGKMGSVDKAWLKGRGKQRKENAISKEDWKKNSRKD